MRRRRGILILAVCLSYIRGPFFRHQWLIWMYIYHTSVPARLSSECGSGVTKGNHTLLRLNILEQASVMANSTAEAVESAVTEFFQINKANK